MEEILASIRRIISEEEQAPTASEPVLDLTQAAAPATANTPEDDIVFEDQDAGQARVACFANGVYMAEQAAI